MRSSIDLDWARPRRPVVADGNTVWSDRRAVVLRLQTRNGQSFAFEAIQCRLNRSANAPICPLFDFVPDRNYIGSFPKAHDLQKYNLLELAAYSDIYVRYYWTHRGARQTPALEDRAPVSAHGAK
jgi:hypothetical protein